MTIVTEMPAKCCFANETYKKAATQIQCKQDKLEKLIPEQKLDKYPCKLSANPSKKLPAIKHAQTWKATECF